MHACCAPSNRLQVRTGRMASLPHSVSSSTPLITSGEFARRSVLLGPAGTLDLNPQSLGYLAGNLLLQPVRRLGGCTPHRKSVHCRACDGANNDLLPVYLASYDTRTDTQADRKSTRL